MNELHRAIQSNRNFKNKVKLIGIGTGNSDFEVNFFRKKYEVDFPLFPDENLSIHKILGELRTPYYIGVQINRDGSDQVFYSKLGGFTNANKFLKSMVKSSGL